MTSRKKVSKSLVLKVGARIVSTKRISRKINPNTFGTVTSIDTSKLNAFTPWPILHVLFDGQDIPFAVTAQSFRIDINDKSFLSRKQVPLKLAYGLSIHGFQGLEIQEDTDYWVHLDNTWENGQDYVGLSRHRCPSGKPGSDGHLFLVGRKFNLNKIDQMQEPKIRQFYKQLRECPATLNPSTHEAPAIDSDAVIMWSEGDEDIDLDFPDYVCNSSTSTSTSSTSTSTSSTSSNPDDPILAWSGNELPPHAIGIADRHKRTTSCSLISSKSEPKPTFKQEPTPAVAVASNVAKPKNEKQRPTSTSSTAPSVHPAPTPTPPTSTSSTAPSVHVPDKWSPFKVTHQSINDPGMTASKFKNIMMGRHPDYPESILYNNDNSSSSTSAPSTACTVASTSASSTAPPAPADDDADSGYDSDL